jgi:glycosyltransferase involved in cell wall biosynthesis
MKIAEIANIIEAVPPIKYGGAELVISTLTEALVKRRHEVSLFATGDSQTKARLVASQPTSIGYSLPPPLAETFRTRHLVKMVRESSQFDIIHNHILETFALGPFLKRPLVTTLHTDLSQEPEQKILQLPEAQNTFFVSISDSQRRALPSLPYTATIYHGIDVQKFPYREAPGDYLLFLGRITPEKGPEIAVEVAKQTGRRLIIAAKIDNLEAEYTKQTLRLFEETPNVEFIGPVGDAKKKELYANAYAFLMPIQWEEPFGLVVIEALACGTPVVAFERGAMPEIITHGKTGFLVKNTKGMIEALSKISSLSREDCRRSVEQKFTLDRMVTDYEKVFEEVIRQYNQ